ncbi:MAG: tetratricopeptide repeat protein [Microcoleaceae cyanobacterium]
MTDTFKADSRNQNPNRHASESPGKQASQLYNQGNVLLDQGQLAEAVALYNQALDADPEFSWAHHKLGDAFAQQRDWQAAIQAYQKSIEIQPNFFWSHHNLGNAFSEISQWQDAAASYIRALEIDEYFCWSYYNLATSLWHSRQHQAAVFAYIKAYKILNNLPGIYPRLGEILLEQIQQQSLKQSLEEYNLPLELQLSKPLENILKLDTIDLDFEIYHQLAQHLEKEGFSAGSIILYHLAEQVNSEDKTLAPKLHQVQQQYLQLEQAIAVARQGAEQNPDSFQAHYKLGTLLARQQDWSGAISAYLKSIQIKPETPLWLYQGLEERLVQLNQIEDAVKIYQSAIQNRPEAVWPYVNLGEVLVQSGRVSEALNYYQLANYQKIKQFHPQWLEEREKLQPKNGPDFIIIGTQKGGTTSLYYYLALHPNIMPSLIKEIEFWEKRFEWGLDWYRANFPPTPADEMILTGEATPSYLDHSDVPERLFQSFPATKLIVLLRNPVDRAISHYYQWIDLKWEWRSLEMAMDLAIAQLENLKYQTKHYAWNQPNNYIARGLYVIFLQKWLSIFPKEQVLILSSEEFYRDPAVSLSEICRFLRLPEYRLKKYNKYNARTYPIAESVVRQKLQDYFEPYNFELEQYLGQKFHWKL